MSLEICKYCGEYKHDCQCDASRAIYHLERENNELRTELAKWKSGCESNAADARDCHLRSDERRRQIIQLRADLKQCAVALDNLTSEIVDRINNPGHPQIKWQQLFDEASNAFSLPSVQAALKEK